MSGSKLARGGIIGDEDKGKENGKAGGQIRWYLHSFLWL